MKRILGLFLFLFLLLPTGLRGQDRTPPKASSLDVFIGEWTYTWQGGNGTWSCEWIGEAFVLCDARFTDAAGVASRLLDIWGVDVEAGVYTWDRFLSTGVTESGEGSITERTWTFLIEQPGNVTSRMIADWPSRDEFTFQWDQRVEGGSWEFVGEGTMTRVK